MADRVGKQVPAATPGHLAEIGEILALGLQRVLARKSSGKVQPSGDCSLDFSLAKSGAAVSLSAEN